MPDEDKSVKKKHIALECIQCGICTAGCPMSTKFGLNVRRLVREAALSGSLTILPEKELWSCTTCSTCEIRCPKGVSPVDLIIDIRSVLVEEGGIPTRIRDALESVHIHGNPWRRVRRERSEWAQGLKVSHVSEGTELLYYVGCTPSYDPRVQNVAKALVACFNSVGVNFGILGNEESCCGNEVFEMGEKALFKFLVKENLKSFEKYGIKQIVTTSPHCYHAFKNRYGKTGFEVQHYTQYIANLIDKEKITFSRELNKIITFHDPCFLGKINGIYEEPRKIIESIPGVKFVELDRSRERSLCCEGGGGRMWIEISVPPPARADRLSEVRVREAIEVGAEILVTACPFCVLNLEDAVKTTRNEDLIQVMDIAELISESL